MGVRLRAAVRREMGSGLDAAELVGAQEEDDESNEINDREIKTSCRPVLRH